jgi:hypothetical protein
MWSEFIDVGSGVDAQMNFPTAFLRSQEVGALLNAIIKESTSTYPRDSALQEQTLSVAPL